MMQYRSGLWAKRLLISTGALAAGVIGSSFIAGWFLVRPGKRRDYDCIPRVRHGRLEPLDLFTRDGLRLHSWVLTSRSAPPDDWVLLLHGYRSDRTVLVTRARFFSRRGHNVMLLHFRGHGSSDRARISYGYHERRDVKAAFDFLRSLRPDGRTRIGIDGISMGAAAAAYAVAHEGVDPDWMILESCYDNIHNALANRLALRVGNSLTSLIAWPVETVVEYLATLRVDDLDPAAALEKSCCPILIMAGDSEKVLKTVEIEYLYGCIPEPKRLVIFPGAGHEDLFLFDPRRYARAAGNFLRDYARRDPDSASRSLATVTAIARPKTCDPADKPDVDDVDAKLA